jgi:glutaredoxin-like YruB-family protein
LAGNKERSPNLHKFTLDFKRPRKENSPKAFTGISFSQNVTLVTKASKTSLYFCEKSDMKEVTSYQDLKKGLVPKGKTYLLLYRPGNALNDRALKHINIAAGKAGGIHLLFADVTRTRDIHPQYHITSVPALLEFENGAFQNVVKGCQEASYYGALFDNALYFAAVKEKEKPQKRVTVYSTPTCSWCNTLKMFLRKNHVHYRDIDVSRDPRVADELVRRSGQTGVPQTDIDGEIIVGFNQARISELLGLKK